VLKNIVSTCVCAQGDAIFCVMAAAVGAKLIGTWLFLLFVDCRCSQCRREIYSCGQCVFICSTFANYGSGEIVAKGSAK
jgi:hypothetical protein